jgi:hypothetical protein
VPRGSLDDEWLPVVGQRSLVLITRDNRIRYRKVQKDRWVSFRVRGFVLTGKRSQSSRDGLALLQRWWATIKSATTDRRTGPWMYSVTQERVRDPAAVASHRGVEHGHTAKTFITSSP